MTTKGMDIVMRVAEVDLRIRTGEWRDRLLVNQPGRVPPLYPLIPSLRKGVSW